MADRGAVSGRKFESRLTAWPMLPLGLPDMIETCKIPEPQQ